MSTIIITYEAKCKHCLFFKYKKLPKMNGEISKKMYAFCENPENNRYGHLLTLKTKACNKIIL